MTCLPAEEAPKKVQLPTAEEAAAAMFIGQRPSKRHQAGAMQKARKAKHLWPPSILGQQQRKILRHVQTQPHLSNLDLLTVVGIHVKILVFSLVLPTTAITLAAHRLLPFTCLVAT